MKKQLYSHISTECPWRDTLYWYDTLDSTNSLAKQMAKEGAPHGTIIVAGQQSGGRGRLGRSFFSSVGGVYLSVILRPNCTPDKLMHLTCAAAVAGCNAVKAACGFCPDIKWTNDLVFDKKKLGGILTELGLRSDGSVEYAIVGVGFNCSQAIQDFPPHLQELATTVCQITPQPCSVGKLAGALIDALYQMDMVLLSEKAAIMDAYRKHCITLGKDVSILRGEEVFHGVAMDLDENGGLVVQFADNTVESITSGEVSVRGMYGYV